jgi:hypothetical protein
MKAVVYNLKTGGIIREINGPQTVIKKERLNDDESILTDNDVIDWPNSLDDKQVDPDKQELIWDVSLSEAKSNKITDVKESAQDTLNETDWYVVRQQETGESIPQEVKDHRAKVRSLSDEFENDVTALASVSDVQEYIFEYPDPPEP